MLILTHRNLQQLQELPKEWLLEPSGSKLKPNYLLGCRPPACPIPWFPLCCPDPQGIAEPELGSFTWMSSWCRLTHFANQGGNQTEKTKGTWFQSHFVPLCSALVCLEQLGFVLGRAVTPKTGQEMGRARVVSWKMWILEVFSGTHLERSGLRVPGFCFSFFSPLKFPVPGSHVCLVPALPPHPLLPEVQSLHKQPRFVCFGFYFQLFP